MAPLIKIKQTSSNLSAQCDAIVHSRQRCWNDPMRESIGKDRASQVRHHLSENDKLMERASWGAPHTYVRLLGMGRLPVSSCTATHNLQPSSSKSSFMLASVAIHNGVTGPTADGWKNPIKDQRRALSMYLTNLFWNHRYIRDNSEVRATAEQRSGTKLIGDFDKFGHMTNDYHLGEVETAVGAICQK